MAEVDAVLCLCPGYTRQRGSLLVPSRKVPAVVGDLIRSQILKGTLVKCATRLNRKDGRVGVVASLQWLDTSVR